MEGKDRFNTRTCCYYAQGSAERREESTFKLYCSLYGTFCQFIPTTLLQLFDLRVDWIVDI